MRRKIYSTPVSSGNWESAPTPIAIGAENANRFELLALD